MAPLCRSARVGQLPGGTSDLIIIYDEPNASSIGLDAVATTHRDASVEECRHLLLSVSTMGSVSSTELQSSMRREALSLDPHCHSTLLVTPSVPAS